MWLPEDTDAALEWIEFQDSLCSGCGFPRHESFNPENFLDRYEVEVVQCHACAARERVSHARASNEDAANEGVYYAVTDEGD